MAPRCTRLVTTGYFLDKFFFVDVQDDRVVHRCFGPGLRPCSIQGRRNLFFRLPEAVDAEPQEKAGNPTGLLPPDRPDRAGSSAKKANQRKPPDHAPNHRIERIEQRQSSGHDAFEAKTPNRRDNKRPNCTINGIIHSGQSRYVTFEWRPIHSDRPHASPRSQQN